MIEWLDLLGLDGLTTQYLNGSVAGILFRTQGYLVFGAGAFVLVWILGRRWLGGFRNTTREPGRKAIFAELKWSRLTILVWAVLSIPFVWAIRNGYTRLYFDKEVYGSLHYWLSFPAVILLHDIYFFFTHKLMHHPAIFKRVHGVHHQSKSPTPLAIFSFHPWEAAVNFGFLGVFFLIPMHVHAMIFFNFFMVAFNAVGHMGHEFFPSWLARIPGFRLINNATHHQMHHERVQGHYSLYFNYLDRWFGHLFPDYEERYAAVTTERMSSMSPK